MIDPGDDVRRERNAGAVTSLLLVVDAHAMALEGGQKPPSVKEPSLITLLATGNWRPLCIGNLSLAVLKKNGLEK